MWIVKRFNLVSVVNMTLLIDLGSFCVAYCIWQGVLLLSDGLQNGDH